MIKNIKIGIKISTRNFDFLRDIYENSKLIDFIEIILMPEFKSKEINILKNLKLPYFIHIPSGRYGIDFGDIKKNKKNLEYIGKINQYSADLKPICYIFHPESGDIAYSISNIQKLELKPIALENMPMKGIFGGKLLAYDVDTMRVFFKKIKDLEFCLDFNHAIKAAISMKAEYFEFIKNFIEFKKPMIFHISQGDIHVEIDDHLPLDKGNYDMKKLKSLLLNMNSLVYLTFETPRDFKKGIKDDIRNIKIFLKI